MTTATPVDDVHEVVVRDVSPIKESSSLPTSVSASVSSAAPTPSSSGKTRAQTNSTAAVPSTGTITVFTSSTQRKRGGLTAMAVTTASTKRTASKSTTGGHASAEKPKREVVVPTAHPAHAHLARVTAKSAEARGTRAAAPPAQDTVDVGDDALHAADELSSLSAHPESQTSADGASSTHEPPLHYELSKDKSVTLSARSCDSATTTSSSMSCSTQGTSSTTRTGPRGGPDNAPEGRYKITLAKLHAKRTKRPASSTETISTVSAAAGVTSAAEAKPKRTKKKRAGASCSSSAAQVRVNEPMPPEVPVDAAPPTDARATWPDAAALLARMHDLLTRQANMFQRVDEAIAQCDANRAEAATAAAMAVPADQVHVPVALQKASSSPLPCLSHSSLSSHADNATEAAGVARLRTPDDPEEAVLSPMSPKSMSPYSHASFSPTRMRSLSGGGGGVSSTAASPDQIHTSASASHAAASDPPTQTFVAPVHTVLLPYTLRGGPALAPTASIHKHGDDVSEDESPRGWLAAEPSLRSILSVSPVSASSSPSASTTSTPSSIPTSLSEPHYFGDAGDDGPSDASPQPKPARTSSPTVSSEDHHRTDGISTSTSASLSPSSLTSAATTPPLGSGRGATASAMSCNGRRADRGGGTPTVSTSSHSPVGDGADPDGAGSGEDGSGRRWVVPPVRVVRRPPMAPVNRPSPLRKSVSHRSDSLYTTSSSTNSPSQVDVELYLRANARLEEEEALQQQQRLQLIFEQQLRQCETEERGWLGRGDPSDSSSSPMSGRGTQTAKEDSAADARTRREVSPVATGIADALCRRRRKRGGDDERDEDGNVSSDSLSSLSVSAAENAAGGARDAITASGHAAGVTSPGADEESDAIGSLSPQSFRVQVVTLSSSAHSRRYVRRRRRHLQSTRHAAAAMSPSPTFGTLSSAPNRSPNARDMGDVRATSPQTDEDERRFDSQMAEIERFKAANLKALRGREEGDEMGMGHNLSLSDMSSRSGDCGAVVPRADGVAVDDKVRDGRRVKGSGSSRTSATGATIPRRRGVRTRQGGVGTAAGPHHPLKHPFDLTTPTHSDTQGSHSYADVLSPCDSATPEEIDWESEEWTPTSSSASSASLRLASPGRTEVIVTEPIADAALSAAKAVALAARFGSRESGPLVVGRECENRRSLSSSRSAGSGTESRGVARNVPPLSLALIEEASSDPPRRPQPSRAIAESRTSTTPNTAMATAAAANRESGAMPTRLSPGTDNAVNPDGGDATPGGSQVTGRTSGTSTPSSIALVGPQNAGADSADEEDVATYTSSPGLASNTPSRTPRFRLARTPRGTSHPNMLGRRRSSVKTTLVSVVTSPAALSRVTSSSNVSAGSPPAGGGNRRRGSHPQPPPVPSPSSATKRGKGKVARPTGSKAAIAVDSPLASTHTSELSSSLPHSGPSELSSSTLCHASSQPTSRPQSSPPPSSNPSEAVDGVATRKEMSLTVAQTGAGVARRRSQTVIEKPKKSSFMAATTPSHANPTLATPAERRRRASVPTLPTSGTGWLQRNATPLFTRTNAGPSSSTSADPTTQARDVARHGDIAEPSAPAVAPARRRASLGDLPNSTSGLHGPQRTRVRAAGAPLCPSSHTRVDSTDADTAPHWPGGEEADGDASRRESHSSVDVSSSNASAHSPPHRRATVSGISSSSPGTAQLDDAEKGTAHAGAATKEADEEDGRDVVDPRAMPTPSDLGDVSSAPVTPHSPYRSPLSLAGDARPQGPAPSTAIDPDALPPHTADAARPLRRSHSESESESESEAMHSPPLLRRGRESEGATPVAPRAERQPDERGSVAKSTSAIPDIPSLRSSARRYTYHHLGALDAGTNTTTATTNTNTTSAGPAVSSFFLRCQQRLVQRDGTRTKAMEELFLSNTLQSQLFGSTAPSPLSTASAMSSADARSVDTTAAPTASVSSSPVSTLAVTPEHSSMRDGEYGAAGRVDRTTPPSAVLTHVSAPIKAEESTTHSHAMAASTPPPAVDMRRRLQTRMTPKTGVSSPSASAAKSKNPSS